MRFLLSIMACISFVCSSHLASVNSETISGVIIDDTGYPVIGAVVMEKGNNKNGTTTDIGGYFELEVEILPAEIIISYVGYADYELEVKSTKPVKLTIQESQELLDEVVVTGYARKNKRSNGKPRASRNSIKSEGHWNSTATIVYNESSETYEGHPENKFTNPLDEPLSTFSIDVDRASYANVRRYIEGGQLPPDDAVRVEEMINYFKYDYAQPKGKHPISIQPTLTACPWNSEHQLLHIGLQGKVLDNGKLPPSNLVFLIDVSGSMSDFNKLPLVKSSLRMLVNNLREEDRVAIVTYAGSDRLALESTSIKDKTKILDAIDRLGSGGSTAGARGIQTAYQIAEDNFKKEGNNRIILATDGDFNVGITNQDQLKSMIEKERQSGVYLSILGYGMGNYRDDIMQTLAEAGNGNHSYIDDIQEADKVLIQEFGGTLFTIAKDVKMQIEFNPSKVAAYRLVGYESRILTKEDFNNDKKDAGDMGSGHAITAIYEIVPQGADSEYVGSVDDLKYQTLKKNIQLSGSPEVATIKFRYKDPDSDTSKKVTLPIVDTTDLKKTDDNVQWSIAVAAFGLKLKSSDYAGNFSYQDIIDLAKQARGLDEEGYRAELIRLVRSVRNMTIN